MTKGTAITTILPSTSGGAIVSCTSSPTLPTGLTLDATTCALSGTPSAITASATYTITATNSAGSANDTLVIVVNDRVPILQDSGIDPYYGFFGDGTPDPNFNYWGANLASFGAGGGTPITCSSSPPLPSGLTLTVGASGCELYGTPPIPAWNSSSTVAYQITASNSGGTSSAVTVSITISADPQCDPDPANTSGLPVCSY